MHSLQKHNKLFLRQIKEVVELFGFETRNKYGVHAENGEVVAYAAEQGKDFLGAVFRHLLGHWRTFEIHFFTAERKLFLRAVHPFRFFFQRLDIFNHDGGLIGAVQQRFSILSKRFDIEDAQGKVLFTVRSPIWRIWTFPVKKDQIDVACISKKWSGLLKETFTDADNFLIEYSHSALTTQERSLLLAAGLFIDLKYFEKKAGR